MSKEIRQILEMLSQDKINSDEAEKLLEALNPDGSGFQNNQNDSDNYITGKPKFLLVKVEKPDGKRHKNVDIKIPLTLLKAGMKLKSLMPSKYNEKFNAHFSEHGIDFNLNDLNNENISTFISALKDNPIIINADNEKVKIACV